MKKTRIFGSLMAVALMLGTTAGIPEMFTGVQDSSIMTVDAAAKTYPVRQTNKRVSLMNSAAGKNVVITLSANTYVSELTCKQLANNKRWYKVRYQRLENKKLVKYEGWIKETDAPYVLTKVMTTTANLNLRLLPSTNSAIMKTITKGDTVHVIGYDKSKKWQRVVWNGATGYCSTDYLR